jgi:hypothetical protein
MNSEHDSNRSGKTSKRVLAVMLVLLMLACLWFLFARQASPEVRQLNARLAADAMLAAYPYPFRVLRLQDTSAVMSSPRSAQMSVHRMISAIDPGLENIAVDDPRFRAAQQRLAEHQAHAAELVLQSDKVDDIEWELDTRWLSEHGIVVKQRGLY